MLYQRVQNNAQLLDNLHNRSLFYANMECWTVKWVPMPTSDPVTINAPNPHSLFNQGKCQSLGSLIEVESK